MAVVAQALMATVWVTQHRLPPGVAGIRVAGKTCSVPSKLRGEADRVHRYALELEVEYAGEVVVRLSRLSGRR